MSETAHERLASVLERIRVALPALEKLVEERELERASPAGAWTVKNIEVPISIGYSEKEIAAAHGRTITELRIVRAALRDEFDAGRGR